MVGPGTALSAQAGCRLPPFHRGCPFFCCESTRQMERIHSGLEIQVCNFDFSWEEIFQNGNLSHSKKFLLMNFPSEWIFRDDVLGSRSHQQQDFSLSLKNTKKSHFPSKDPSTVRLPKVDGVASLWVLSCNS